MRGKKAACDPGHELHCNCCGGHKRICITQKGMECPRYRMGAIYWRATKGCLPQSSLLLSFLQRQMNKSNVGVQKHDESFLKSERLPRICGHVVWFPFRFKSHLADDLFRRKSSLNCIPLNYSLLFSLQLRCNHKSESKSF